MWAIDIGTRALAAQESGFEVKTTNGIWARSPLRQYHLGLILVILSLLSLTFVSIRSIFGDLDVSKGDDQ